MEVLPDEIMDVDTIVEEQSSTHRVGIENFLLWAQGMFEKVTIV